MNGNSIPLVERFWSKVQVAERSRCWEWTGHRDKHGYGMCRDYGKVHRAHRLAYFLRHGRMPQYACHRCDNPACCNPDHIYDGDHKRNMQDKKERHRARGVSGEMHYKAVLTNKIAEQIRSQYKSENVSITTLAKRHGVSFSVIQRVIARKVYV